MHCFQLPTALDISVLVPAKTKAVLRMQRQCERSVARCSRWAHQDL